MAQRRSMLASITQRKVLLCVGPGGVGKTTAAAAVALCAAQRDRRVAVVTIDPSRRLAQALGLDRAGIEPGALVRVLQTEAGSLDALLLDATRVFDDIVRSCAADAAAANGLLQNPIYQATARRLGGALEYAAMARVQMLYSSNQHDLIILDTPPTANAIDFLESPGRVREVVANPAARLLSGTGKIGMKILGLGGGVFLKTLQAIGGGPFVGDLGAFLNQFGAVLGEFQRRAGDFEALLASPDTGVVLTTSVTDFSVREARDFLATLREHGLRIEGVVLNQVDPEVAPMPPIPRVREALAAQIEGDVDAALAKVVEAYKGTRLQGEQGLRAREVLEQAYPEIPIHLVDRRDPPPTTLDDLREMGETLFS